MKRKLWIGFGALFLAAGVALAGNNTIRVLREYVIEYVQTSTPTTPGSGRNRIYVASDGKIHSLNSSGVDSIIAGDFNSVPVNQVAHGFSVGDLVRLNGAGTYTKSQGDSAADAEIEGMVSAVADADNFTLTEGGYVTGLSGLTANTRYFLDDATAGAMTATPPTTASHVSKYVFVADSTTSGYVDIQPGRVIESQQINSGPSVSSISALDIDWSILKISGGIYTKTLGANSTFTFSNKTAGQTIVVRLTNTASNYTVTWPTVKWAGGAAPTMTVGATSDIYTFVYDGTDVFGSVVQDMH